MAWKLAILGDEPAFTERVPLARPTLPDIDPLLKDISGALQSQMLTNAVNVRMFEAEAADYLGVEDVVAVANCTTGLMLLLRCLDLTGGVIVPSFTFMASGHAVLWNGLGVDFADSDVLTCTIDPESASAAVNGRTAGLLATHTFGSPCDAESLQALADRTGIPLLFDAAHGFGSRYPDGRMVGSKGLAEVFSLSPTKPLSTGEGGLIATGDPALARELRLAREYGNTGSYDSRYAGLNGRMTEIAALIGRAGLRAFPRWLERRRELVERYKRHLTGVPGIAFQAIPAGAESSFKDFAVRIDPEFGLTRDQVAECLAMEGISTRPYFDPPLHRQATYRDVRPAVPLDGTERLSASMLTLPLYSHMEPELIDGMCAALMTIHDHTSEVAVHFAAAASQPEGK